jgi:Fatty acid desaturase
VQPRETMGRLPRPFQPYLTWVTGAPLAGGRPFIRWTARKAALLGIGQTAAGVAVGGLVLAHLSPATVPILVLSLLLTTGGMRRLDVVVVHQTLHRMFAKTPERNRVVGELVTTLLWRMPYDKNREEHLIHHAFPCSLRDQDTRYLMSTGMRPGMTRGEYRRYLAKALVSPRHHGSFLHSRMRGNLTPHQRRYRLAMSVAYLGATSIFLALTGLWIQYLVLWFVPVTILFQGATFLYTQTEHRWWVFSNAERLSRIERDQLTFGRMCGDPVPDVADRARLVRLLAWTKWWLRLLLVHSTYRLFVLVGDTVQHDLHHVQPGCDWPNSPYVRRADVARTPERYTEVWGSIVDHLHASGEVRSDQMSPTPQPQPQPCGATQR